MTLQQFFEQYSKAYSALDARAVSAMFTRPFTAVHHGVISVFGIDEEKALYQTTLGILEYYRSQGVCSAQCQILETLCFGNDLASVNVLWTAQRQNAEPWVFTSGYQLKRENEQWRIYGLIQFDERRLPAA